MSAMKPDGWINDRGDYSGSTSNAPFNVYSAETIRKWLKDEPNGNMVHAGLIIMEGDGALTSVSEVFEAMLAAKLRELEGS